MLIALKNDGERVYAGDIYERGGEYYCPECGEKLIFRKGIKNIPHFAHTGESICHFRKGGESHTHNFMKKAIKEIIERDNNCSFSELEWRIEDNVGNHVIADYYFMKKDRYGKLRRCAVECVYKHDDLTHFINKNRFYLQNNVYPIWIFDLDKFLKKDNDFKEQVRINSILKEAHLINFGKVWALDYKNKAIYAIHLDSCQTYVEPVELIDWDNWDGHSDPSDLAYSVGGYYKSLPMTKRIIPKYVKHFNVNSFSFKRADNFCYYDRLIASPFLEKFW